MFKRLLTAALLFAMAAAAPPAQAANCAMRDVVTERLAQKYSERLTAGGLHVARARSAMVEVWASEETGTFTVMLTSPTGIACIIATGTDWFEAARPEAEPAGTPS